MNGLMTSDPHVLNDPHLESLFTPARLLSPTLSPLPHQRLRALITSPHTLSAGFLVNLLPALRHGHGVDTRSLMAELGMSEQAATRGNEYLPADKVVQLLAAISPYISHESPGVFLGRSATPKSFQLLGYLMLSADTLGDAISLLGQYHEVLGQAGHLEVSRENDHTRISWHPAPLLADETALTECIVTALACLLKQLPRHHLNLAQASFSHPPAAPLEDYQQAFGCTVQFNASLNAIAIPDFFLDLSLPMADPLMHQIMLEQIQAQQQDINLIAETRAQIARQIGTCDPSLETIAAGLGLHHRQLRDKLTARGCHFKTLVDSTRKDLALALAQDPSLSLLDITHALGMSEQSSLSRAFKRWTGLSPKAYRNRYRSRQGTRLASEHA